MPKALKTLPITIGVRVSEADVHKLNALATLSGRRPAEVLRLLLRRARFQGEDLIVGTALPESGTTDMP
jgi:hypothetical protein